MNLNARAHLGNGCCIEDELICLFGGAEPKHALGDSAAYDVGGSEEDGARVHGGVFGRRGPNEPSEVRYECNFLFE